MNQSKPEILTKRPSGGEIITLLNTFAKRPVMPKQGITEKTIRAAVCRQFRVTKKDIASPSRKQHIVLARHTYSLLCKDILGQSYSTIARKIKRHQCTIYDGIVRLRGYLSYQDPLITPAILHIQQQLA